MKLLIFCLLSLAFVLGISGCKSERKGCTDPKAINYDPKADVNAGNCITYLPVTQELLDSARTPTADRLSSSFLGFDLAHDGSVPPRNGDFTVRTIYSNTQPYEQIRPGAVFGKKVWKKKADGSKDTLLASFLMVKQAVGYYPTGGDYEYIAIFYDKNNDYNKHFFGKIGKAALRGKLESCANCHSNGGTDYLFIR